METINDIECSYLKIDDNLSIDEKKRVEQKLIEQSDIELINELFSNDIIEKYKEIKHTTIWKGKCSKKGRKTNK
jgi:hypothetical protein